MKLKETILISFSFLTTISCSNSWLDPEPLSTFEPSKALSTEEGLESILASCEAAIRTYYMGQNGPALATEMIFSDVAVESVSDFSGCQNIENYLTPTSNNNWMGTNMSEYFWLVGYKGINYANIVVSRLQQMQGMDETMKTRMLSRAYFLRAYNYYNLINQFGDIPVLLEEMTKPRFDFRSVKMSVVIEKMISDLEYAVEHASDYEDYGKENRAACRMLLSKFYLENGNFDKAINQLNTLIDNSGYELMTTTFGTFENPHPEEHPITRNVIWDLHRPNNKAIPANKETIKVLVSRYENEDSRCNSLFLYNMTPYWALTDPNRGILAPNKSNLGLSWQPATPEYLTRIPIFRDERAIFGRGESFSRPTYWAEKGMWNDSTDLRHSHKAGNWFVMEDLTYNNVALLMNADSRQFYGKHIQKYAADGTLLCRDTIRCWYDWPYYKLWVYDPDCEVANGYTNVYYNGGPGDWYLMRLAEAYLLRAEAHFWKGEYASAADDVNTIRKRAQCSALYTAADMQGIEGLDRIFDERARELMYEEFRHVELVRASYIKTNHEGTFHSLKDLSEGTADSYWWYRVNKYNNYYNKGVTTLHNDEYRIAKRNIFYPIPQTSIDANLYAKINQNYGYSGSEDNEEPISSLAELKSK